MPKIQTIQTCFQGRLTVILEVRGSRRLKLDFDPRNRPRKFLLSAQDHALGRCPSRREARR